MFLSNGPYNGNYIGSCTSWEKEMVGIGSTAGYLDDKALELHEFRPPGLVCIHTGFQDFPFRFYLPFRHVCSCGPRQVGHVRVHCPVPTAVYKG